MLGYFCRRSLPALHVPFLNAVCSYIADGPDLKELPEFRNVVHGTSKRNLNVIMHQGQRLEQSQNSICMLEAAVSESKYFLWSPESCALKVTQQGILKLRKSMTTSIDMERYWPSHPCSQSSIHLQKPYSTTWRKIHYLQLMSPQSARSSY